MHFRIPGSRASPGARGRHRCRCPARAPPATPRQPDGLSTPHKTAALESPASTPSPSERERPPQRGSAYSARVRGNPACMRPTIATPHAGASGACTPDTRDAHALATAAAARRLTPPARGCSGHHEFTQAHHAAHTAVLGTRPRTGGDTRSGDDTPPPLPTPSPPCQNTAHSMTRTLRKISSYGPCGTPPPALLWPLHLAPSTPLCPWPVTREGGLL